MIRSGKVEGFPYSLSRWTDVPAAKWAWFRANLERGFMLAFDPTTAVPSRWSLKPEDTLGLTFWTKDPTNLLVDKALLLPFLPRLKIHVTVTGWEEVEKGAPGLAEGADLLRETAETFGSENVYWRFSPVPLLPLPELTDRFERIARVASRAGLDRVYLAFLQNNDLMPETRDREGRLEVLSTLAKKVGLRILLCNEDTTLHRVSDLPLNVGAGVCAPPEDFDLPGFKRPPCEGCGCALMVDPFTINESCTFGCTYCYAADKTMADKKRNTTRRLPVLRAP